MKNTFIAAALASIAFSSSVFAGPIQYIDSYDVQISLSSAVETKLKNSGETITISAVYFGEPLAGKSHRKLTAEDGNIYFNNEEEKSILGADTVTMGHVKYDSDLLKHIVGGEPNVLINVHSSRKKFENNLLDCDIFQDKVSVAAKTPIVLNCKLIGE